jgi:PQQ-like domain
MKTSLLGVTALLTGMIANGGEPCGAMDLRAATAKIVWRTTDVVDVHVEGGSVFVETQKGLRKLIAGTGEEAWSYPFKEEGTAPQFVVLPDRVAVVQDERIVVFLDRDTGVPVARTDAGEWIRFLAGPPLLAVTQGINASISTFVRLSPEGPILGTRIVPLVSDIRIVDGVAAVQVESGFADPELDTLTGYDLATLEPLWSVTSFTFNTQVIGGKLYAGDIFWSEGARVIDPRSGSITALIPIRDPFQIGGSGEFDLQVVNTRWTGAWSPDYATCEVLRRNDPVTARTLWNTELPLRVSATLRDGARLYVAGNRDVNHRYLVVLDWKTGRIERAWSGVPKLSRLEKAAGLLVGYDPGGELVAVRLADR